jgi:ferredoxin-nitrate reductase
VSPVDADRLGVRTGDPIEVASPRGALRAHALVTAAVSPGQLFVAMHDPGVNRLTHPSFDPASRQPSYKYAAAAIRPLDPWERT